LLSATKSRGVGGDPPDIRALAGTARAVAEAWSVDLGDRFAFSRYSYVAPAREGAVLKIVPLDEELSRVAHDLYARFDRRAATRVHGDFHHHNILRSARGWLAIDPKPMIAEPAYDVASFLWNPLSQPMRADVTDRRLGAFARAGVEEERMRTWAVVRGAYLCADPEERRLLRGLAP
jgi:5-methylthioribose kinase